MRRRPVHVSSLIPFAVCVCAILSHSIGGRLKRNDLFFLGGMDGKNSEIEATATNPLLGIQLKKIRAGK